MFSKEESRKLRQEFWTSFGKSFPKKWILYDTKIKGLSFKFHFDTKSALIALDLEDVATRLPGPRSIRLDSQFHAHHCAIVGLQETRTPEGRRVTDHYLVLSSGFQQCGRSRHFGCELWLHRSLHIATDSAGTKVSLSAFSPVVLHSTARLLIVRLQGPFDLFFLWLAMRPAFLRISPLITCSSGGMT